jgi:hypothetical protein
MACVCVCASVCMCFYIGNDDVCVCVCRERTMTRNMCKETPYTTYPGVGNNVSVIETDIG